MQKPPMASMLYAIEISSFSRDTIFSNQYMAYGTLSEGLKRTLSELFAVNTSSKQEVSMTRENRKHETGMGLNILSSLHPVFRTHTDSGIQAFYDNKAHTTHFEDLTDKYSKSLLNFLFKHQVKTDFTYRYRREKNTLAS